jgi:maleate isomerase
MHYRVAGLAEHGSRQRVLPQGLPAEPHRLRYGTRLRIGMIIPSVASNAEAHITAMLPDGVSLHTTRLKMDEKDANSMLNFTDKVEEAASLLKDAGANHILVNCTAVTTADPAIGARIRERILKATGLPSSTTGDRVIAALKRLNARKVVMLTPYRNDINEREVRYLNHYGFEVVDWKGLELYGAQQFDDVAPAAWHQLALAHRHDEADVYFLSCAQVRVIEVLGAIEHDLGRPAISSNQCAAWHILRQNGINDPVAGFGTLLQL